MRMSLNVIFKNHCMLDVDILTVRHRNGVYFYSSKKYSKNSVDFWYFTQPFCHKKY